MDFDSIRDGRKDEFKRLYEDLRKKDVEFLQVHFADLNGLIRTKYASLKLSTEGDVLNTCLYGVAHADGAPVGDVVFDSPAASAETGYQNILALPDPSSLAVHNWRPNTASVFLETYSADRSRCPLDTRQVLQRLEQRGAALGLQALFAVEYEFSIFHRDDALLRAGRFDELVPYGHSFTNYDMLRAGDYETLIQEFMQRMASFGGVTSFVSEYGNGMYEFALKPATPLAAADLAMRAKHHLKELCLEHGLLASFMVRFRPVGVESACGAHHHQSLVRLEDGENAFFDAGGLSKTGRHYVAGLLDTLVDSHLIYRPTINAYRRFDRYSWSPEEVCWGFENRLTPVRVIDRPGPGAFRVEHRAPGSDVNPYLSIAAMLGGGLKGIEEELEPMEPIVGDPTKAGRFVPLPRTLEGSIGAFRDSAFVHELLGEDLCEQYLVARTNELAAYRAWYDSVITDFEFQRYFTGV